MKSFVQSFNIEASTLLRQANQSMDSVEGSPTRSMVIYFNTVILLLESACSTNLLLNACLLQARRFNMLHLEFLIFSDMNLFVRYLQAAAVAPAFSQRASTSPTRSLPPSARSPAPAAVPPAPPPVPAHTSYSA